MSSILEMYARGGVNRPSGGRRMTTMSGPPAGVMGRGAHAINNEAKKNSGGFNGGGVNRPSLSDFSLAQQLMAGLASTDGP
mgnify:CR=1 FL=1|jgi:hypothetical protein